MSNLLHIVVSILFAGVLSLILGYLFIGYGVRFVRSRVREYTPERHQSKNNTPTMGGIFMLAALLIGVLISGYSIQPAVIMTLLGTLGYGVIGFMDDWYKITAQKGVTARTKFIAQWLVAGFIALGLVYWAGISTDLVIPGLGILLPLGLAYIPWIMFVIVSTSNAVNLTDGLDGLAATVLVPNMLFFSLCLFYQGAMGLVYLGMIAIGALLGFLKYNWHPARVFMGDVGALSFGALYALLAIQSGYELLIPLVGIIFLLEELSVILQVASMKLRKKRIFKMAPIHHHFELSGWSEIAIVGLFGTVSIIMATICLFVFIK